MNPISNFLRTLRQQSPSPAILGSAARTSSRRQKTDEEIIQEGREEAQKELEAQQEAQAKADKAAADAALRAQNNAKEAAWRAEKRPMYVDADGVIQPVQPDEIWEQQKREKAVKSQEVKAQAEQKAADSKLRQQMNAGTAASRAAIGGVDDQIKTATSEAELKAMEKRQAKQRADRQIKEIEDRLENEVLKPEQIASAEQGLAALKQQAAALQTDLDGAETSVIDRKKQELAWEKERQRMQREVQQFEAGIPLMKAPEGQGLSRGQGVKTAQEAPVVGVGERPEIIVPGTPEARQKARERRYVQSVRDIEQSPALTPEQRKAALATVEKRFRDPKGYEQELVASVQNLSDEELAQMVKTLDYEVPNTLAEIQTKGAIVDDLEAQHQARVQRLLAAREQVLQNGVSMTDSVTLTLPSGEQQMWPAKLAESYIAAEKRHALALQQAGYDDLMQDVEEHNLEASKAQAAQAEMARRREMQMQAAEEEKQATFRVMSITGQSGTVADMTALEKSAQDRIKSIEQAHAEGSPQRKAAMQAVLDDVKAQEQGIRAKAAKQAESGAKLYDMYRDFNVSDWKAEKDFVRLKQEAQKMGLNDKDALYWMDYYQQADWNKPRGGTPPRDGYQRLGDEIHRGVDAIVAEHTGMTPLTEAEQVRVLPDGQITVNPVFHSDGEKYAAAVKAAPASKEAKEAAMKAFPALEEAWGEQQLEVLESEAFVPALWDFNQWREGKLRSNPDFSRKTLGAQTVEFLKMTKDRPWYAKLIETVARRTVQGTGAAIGGVLGAGGLLAGMLPRGLDQQLAAIPKAVGDGWAQALGADTDELLQGSLSENLSTAGAAWTATGQKFGQANRIKGNESDLGLRAIGQTVELLPQIATMIAGAGVAGGSLKGVAALSAAQTAGAQYADTYATLRKKGASHEDAWAQSAPYAVASGLVTATLTAASGARGIEALAVKPKEMKAVMNAAWKQAYPKLAKTLGIGYGAVSDIAEELPDELFSQISEAMAANRGADVSKIVGDFIASSPELMLAVGAMGAGGELMGGDQPAAGAVTEPTQAAKQPEVKAAAAAAVEAYADPQKSPEAVAVTKARAGALLKIAQGAKLEDLNEAELNGVGFARDMQTGEMKPGYYTNDPKTGALVWKSGETPPNQRHVYSVPDAQGKPQLVIPQASIDRLKQVMPEVAEAIKLDEAARVAQIKTGRQGDSETAAPETQKPESAEVAAAWEELIAAKDLLSKTTDPAEQAALIQRIEAAKQIIKPAKISPKMGVVEATPDRGASPKVGAVAATGAMDTAESGSRSRGMGTLAGGDSAAPPAGVSSAESKGQEALSLPEEERAEQLAFELGRRGLDEQQAGVAARLVVKRMGVNPEGYAVQMAGTDFDDAMTELGWVRGTGKKWVLAVPERWEAATATAEDNQTIGQGDNQPFVDQINNTGSTDVPQPATAKQADTNNKEPASKVGYDTGKLTPIETPELIQSKVWYQAKVAAMDGFIREFAKGRSKQTEAAVKSMQALERLIDTKFGRLFDRIAIGEAQDGGGLGAMMGRDGQTVLVISPAAFIRFGARTDGGLELALSEEVIHAFAQSKLSQAEVVEKVRQMEKHAPEMIRVWWQTYYAPAIQDGNMPATPPAKLSDAEAYHAGHEILRMMVQDAVFAGKVFDSLTPGADTVTTETVEALAGIVEWLKQALKTMGQTLKSALGKLEPAERASMQRVIEDIADLYQRAVESGQKISDLVYWQKQAAEAIERARVQADKAAMEPSFAKATEAKDEAEDDLADAADAYLDGGEKEAKIKKATGGAVAQSALVKRLNEIPDPGTDMNNIIVAIVRNGRITRPSKAYLQRQSEQGGNTSFAEWDWMERTPIPFPFSNLVFKAGNGSTLNRAIQDLHERGYFPGTEAGDVTGDMVAAKILEVIDLYNAKKTGNDQDSQEQRYWDGLEEQALRFERATESGPIDVHAASLQVGDVMMLKGPDGQPHRVEVINLDIQPATEEELADHLPNVWRGDDGSPVKLANVTLKDGTTFGVQTISGDERIYVDALTVKPGQEGQGLFDEASMAMLGDKGTKGLFEQGLGARAMGSKATAQDAEYLAAVEAGDMAKAQAMVDAAAKDAGYASPKMFRKETSEFDTYDPKKKRRSGSERGIIWWTDNQKTAEAYSGDYLKTAYLKYENPLEINAYHAVKDKSWADYVKWAKEDGNDAVILRMVMDVPTDVLKTLSDNDLESDVIGVFKPNQIKSAAPVTRDESGKVIPLSQRFNPESDSILYSRAMRTTPATEQAFSQRLATAKAEILADMRDGTVPASVTRFSDLHDYVDANLYVNDADRQDRVIGPLGKSLGWKVADYTAFTNRLIQAVDEWLQSPHRGMQPATHVFPDGYVLTEPGVQMLGARVMAYHGTPHKVDKFSLDKIGTGEGAQAYGWGLYFAESDEVAKQYQKVLSLDSIRYDGQRYDNSNPRHVAASMVASDGSDGALTRALALLEVDGSGPRGKLLRGVIKAIRSDDFAKREQTNTGNIYTVELLADEEEFLDWDKPLSEQKNPKLNALKKQHRAFLQDPAQRISDKGKNGDSLYHMVTRQKGSEKAASEYFASLGIPGIRYLDGNSRNTGKGTRNYVIFDEKLVRILKENGQPVEQALGSRAMRGQGSLFGNEDLSMFGAGPLFPGTTQGGKAELFQRQSDNQTIRQGDREPVSPDTAPAFSLESASPEQLRAEATRREQTAKIKDRQSAPLIGTQGDIGQMDMLGGGDLFASPAPRVDTPRQDAPVTAGPLESDRPRGTATDGGREAGVSADAGLFGADAGRVGADGEGSQNAEGNDRAADGGAAPAGRAGGAEPVQGTASRVPGSPAGSAEPPGSRGIDDKRAAVESGAELDLFGTAPERPATDEVAEERESTPSQRLIEQATVQNTAEGWADIVPGDLENIARTVPILLSQQQMDVKKAEDRWFNQQPTDEDPKKGMLFTNGTGTGKTFTGLGIIKRFEMMGRGRVLIVVPNQTKVIDWQTEGLRAMVKATPLNDTNDVGKGIVVTTYANFRANSALQAEPWDLVVYDESHTLGGNAQGTQTENMSAHYRATNKPGWYAQQKAEYAVIGPRPDSENKEAVYAYEELRREKADEIKAKIAIFPDTKAVFLSATPFNYHKNLGYADGYLFNSPRSESSAYNVPQGMDRYLVENFGYTMKTNRLTSPPPEVDVGLMEREWAERQFVNGAMSGRMIDVPFDYSREFILLDSKLGQQLDEGFRDLAWGPSGESRTESTYWEPLRRAFRNYWYGSAGGYTKRMQLMESIKVAAALERMNQHIALGRKIVLFHSYNNADPVHPFTLNYLPLPTAEASKLAAEWRQKHPELAGMDFKRLFNPRALVADEFGDRARFFNGEVSPKERAAAVKAFNDDNSGVDIIMLQMEAGKEGISLHDVTGTGRQRVLMNAALPVKPTDAIQSEGRIYRIGVMSNAIQEYLTLHTAMERSAFGSKISERTGTVENMALGKMARTLKDSFKSGYLNAHSEAPSAEQGLGGKKQDAAELLGSDMDRAKSYYFSRQKKTSRNKAAEGVDYFATPEPVGLTMVRFLNAKAGMDLLEPSAGHGAIGRFFPEFTTNKYVEPSRTLSDELRIKVAAGKVEVMPFEDLHIVNKFDGVAMNPPFGTAGKMAMEHVAKAAKHLRQGGRLVALIPEGPAMEKRFEQWLYEGEGKDMHLRASYGLPTVTFERAGTSVKTRIVVLDKADLWEIRKEGDHSWLAYDSFGTKRISRQGDEATLRAMAKNMHDFIGFQGEVDLQGRSPRELSAETIGELFDQLENLSPPGRIVRDVATEAVTEDKETGRGKDLETQKTAPAAAPSNTSNATSSNISNTGSPYAVAETLHAKKGTMTYVAKMERRLSDTEYRSELSRAKAAGGYYSAFKGSGAIPGFQFPSAAVRDAFVAGYGAGQVLGSRAMRGGNIPGEVWGRPLPPSGKTYEVVPNDKVPESQYKAFMEKHGLPILRATLSGNDWRNPAYEAGDILFGPHIQGDEESKQRYPLLESWRNLSDLALMDQPTLVKNMWRTPWMKEWFVQGRKNIIQGKAWAGVSKGYVPSRWQQGDDTYIYIYEGNLYRGESTPPTAEKILWLKSTEFPDEGIGRSGHSKSGLSASFYPRIAVQLSNGAVVSERVRISDHPQVSANAPRQYQIDLRPHPDQLSKRAFREIITQQQPKVFAGINSAVATEWHIQQNEKRQSTSLTGQAGESKRDMLGRGPSKTGAPNTTTPQDKRNLNSSVDQEAHEAATSPNNPLPEPTQAQKEAGNYKLGHVRISGHDISIENPAGSERKGTDPSGKAWSVTMQDHYGYFKGTNAKDGDHVDVFVKAGTPADYTGPVHIVRQVKPGTRQFDEYKVMLGYPTAEEARAAYLRNYAKGWQGLDKLTSHTQAEFQVIKDQVFTVPGPVREGDRVLAARAMRSGNAAELDAEYLAAVEAGDITKAQAMVDEAAKDAGYDSPKMFRKETAEFDIYDPKKKRRSGSERGIIWWTDNQKTAEAYSGDTLKKAYLKYENPLEINAYHAVKDKSWADYVKWAKEDGNDAVILRMVMDVPADVLKTLSDNDLESDVIGVFKPNQIKSADPVTRDASGKVIPLSQRFNSESDSILNARPMRSGSEMVADSLDAVGNVIAKTGNAMFVTLPVWTASTAANVGSAVVEKTGVQKPLAWLGSNRLDKWVYENWTNKWLWARARTGKDAVKAWLNKPGALNGVGKAIADNALPLWSVPREWLAMMHESQRKAAWGREKAMDVIRALSHSAKVSDLAYPKEFVENLAYRVQMFDAMEGKIPMSSLPKPLQDLAARLRGMLETTGRELVKQGLMNLDTFEELRDTGWMPRFTEDEAGETAGSWLKAFKLGIKDLKQQRSTAWHIVDTTRKDATGQYVTVNFDVGAKKNRWRFRDEQARNGFYEDFIRREAVRFLKEQGPNVTNMLAALKIDDKKSIRDEIGNITREDIDLPGKMTEPMRNIVRRAVELQRIRYKKEKPFEPDKLIKDPVYAVARYVMAQTHNAATAELMKETAKVKSWVSEVDIQGFTLIPDTPRFGPLSGKFVRDDIATQVLDVVNVDDAAMKFYDSMLRKWKGGKLVLNPGSHIRDAVGNTAFAYLGGNSLWNPGNWPHYRDAIATLRDGGDKFAELIEMQVLGGDAYTTQVKTALRGLLPDQKTVENADAGALMRMVMGLGAGARGTYEYLSALRSLPDDFYKTAAYNKYRAQGMDPREAAAEVRKWFPYYDRLGTSTYWKVSGRFLNPFGSFFRESTRIMARAAMERPMALSAVMLFATAVTRYSLMALGLGDDDEEAVFRAMRGKLKGGVMDAPVFSMLLPMRTSEGQLQQWDLSSVMPFADLIGTRVESREGEDEFTKFWRGLFTASPILAAAWSASTNTDAFTGRKIVQDDMGVIESTGERLKNFAGDILPPLTPGVGVHAATLSNAGRRTGSLEMRNKYQSWIRAVLGMDVRSADPDLRKETAFFRKQNNLPVEGNTNTYTTPLKSRLAADIRGELIQDEPALDKIAEAMARLEASGNPIRTPKQMTDLLDSLDPTKLIKKEFRTRLIASFSPEARRVFDNRQTEFKKSQAKAPGILAEIRRQKAAGNE